MPLKISWHLNSEYLSRYHQTTSIAGLAKLIHDLLNRTSIFVAAKKGVLYN